MRQVNLSTFLNFGRPLFMGGGASAPPSPPPTAAQVRADEGQAKAGVNNSAKRRTGGKDAMDGSVLGSLKKQGGQTSTLGGSAPAYTGEP